MTKKRWVVFSVLLLMMAIPLFSCNTENSTIMEIQDREEINQLMWRYVRALDTGDTDAYVATFAPDGQFGRGENAAIGHEALKKKFMGFKTAAGETDTEKVQQEQMHHFISHSYIEFIDKDSARFHAYWMTIFVKGSRENAIVRVAAAGRQCDEVVRLDGQWLIKLRDVPDTTRRDILYFDNLL